MGPARFPYPQTFVWAVDMGLFAKLVIFRWANTMGMLLQTAALA